MTVGELRVWAPDGIPEVVPGDDLVALLVAGLRADAQAVPDHALQDGDVIVVTSKVVSKAEGRVISADDRERAITDETVRVVATREHAGGVTRIVENHLGLVMAAAGVDASNTPEGTVLLLPLDPDASARALRAGLTAEFGVRIGVLVTDTAGRPWRQGVTDLAIGAAGVQVLDDLRGQLDTFGRPLTMTVAAVADEIASAAELVKGKASGRPVAVVRGVGHVVTDDDGPGARVLVRTGPDDMFHQGSAEAYAQGWKDALARPER
ncbi:coenzyme F420-0:L-glutamate ligase [Cellulomonas dongxiuzhuiae]|uniref:Coenzyme F420-0:L-glutamate ligase n=1 Tax=Cellulomonas dongxiuzhuiae TaxID=2819979 RepID=A0ABX8GNR6_9CELL|nr:coenzyme F420-0:L-glutamate ligase [Cellulomonas dongxiuzhuiae]MBO3096022.1 coenzyme F420-0:L-glutamate ligase [Cellulomonas dongxiuzhuiae]QWC17302.1 coenzyme F420-0:L-glutamate ligase [Cellulomonas dongxiuzhuiae]